MANIIIKTVGCSRSDWNSDWISDWKFPIGIPTGKIVVGFISVNPIKGV